MDSINYKAYFLRCPLLKQNQMKFKEMIPTKLFQSPIIDHGAAWKLVPSIVYLVASIFVIWYYEANLHENIYGSIFWNLKILEDVKNYPMKIML